MVTKHFGLVGKKEVEESLEAISVHRKRAQW